MRKSLKHPIWFTYQVDSPSLARSLRSVTTPRNVAGLFAIACWAVYLSVLVSSYVGDSRVLESYSTSLGQLRTFASQYSRWPLDTIPAPEFFDTLTAFNKARADAGRTRFRALLVPNAAVRRVDEENFDSALSEIGAMTACLRREASNDRCIDFVSEDRREFDIVVKGADERRALAEDGSFRFFAQSFIVRTQEWLSLAVLLTLVFVVWNRLGEAWRVALRR